MRKKIIILFISAFVALLVFSIGIFGLNQSKMEEKKTETNLKEKSGNTTYEDTQENTDSGESDASGESESAQTSEEPVSENITTSAEEETTASGNVFTDQIDPSRPMVALTFDDGPSDNTLLILEELRKYNAHATFFAVGYNIDGREDVIKSIHDEGSEVANHTASHSKLTSLDAAGIMNEVNSVSDRIKAITGQETVLLRPPYGAVDENVMACITDPVILWSIDTEDWKSRNAEIIIQNVKSSVTDGSIILMHDLYSETAQAAVSLIEWLTNQGYQLVTVSEMGYYRRGGLQLGIRYGSMPPA